MHESKMEYEILYSDASGVGQIEKIGTETTPERAAMKLVLAVNKAQGDVLIRVPVLFDPSTSPITSLAGVPRPSVAGSRAAVIVLGAGVVDSPAILAKDYALKVGRVLNIMGFGRVSVCNLGKNQAWSAEVNGFLNSESATGQASVSPVPALPRTPVSYAHRESSALRVTGVPVDRADLIIAYDTEWNMLARAVVGEGEDYPLKDTGDIESRCRELADEFPFATFLVASDYSDRQTGTFYPSGVGNGNAFVSIHKIAPLAYKAEEKTWLWKWGGTALGDFIRGLEGDKRVKVDVTSKHSGGYVTEKTKASAIESITEWIEAPAAQNK